MTRLLTAAEVAELRGLIAKATPNDEHTHLIRYEHGGGRLFRETDPSTRNRAAIADFYSEADRELFVALRYQAESLLAAADENARLREQIALDPHFGYEPEYDYNRQRVIGWYCRGPRCGQKEGEAHLDGCPFGATPAPEQGDK